MNHPLREPPSMPRTLEERENLNNTNQSNGIWYYDLDSTLLGNKGKLIYFYPCKWAEDYICVLPAVDFMGSVLGFSGLSKGVAAAKEAQKFGTSFRKNQDKYEKRKNLIFNHIPESNFNKLLDNFHKFMIKSYPTYNGKDILKMRNEYGHKYPAAGTLDKVKAENDSEYEKAGVPKKEREYHIWTSNDGKKLYYEVGAYFKKDRLGVYRIDYVNMETDMRLEETHYKGGGSCDPTIHIHTVDNKNDVNLQVKTDKSTTDAPHYKLDPPGPSEPDWKQESAKKNICVIVEYNAQLYCFYTNTSNRIKFFIEQLTSKRYV